MRKQGSITAYMCLILILMLSLISGTLVSVRDSHARVMTACAMEQGLYSLFAQYDRALLGQYELFFVNGGYESGVWQPEKMSREIVTAAQEVLSPAAPGGGIFSGTIGKGKITETYLSGYRLATDQKGEAFKRQVCEAMKASLGTYGIQQLSQKLQKEQITIENQQKHNETYQQEEAMKKYEESKSLQEGSQETAGEGADGENPPADQDPGTQVPKDFVNPIEVIQKVMKMGLLGLVLPEGETLPQQSVDPGTLVSKRKLQSGFGMIEREVDEKMTEKLLLAEYLLWKFPCYTKGENPKGIRCQVEYAICEKADDLANLEGTVRQLLLLREAANILHLYTDAEKQAQMEAMAGVIAASLGIPAALVIIQAALAVCWAFAESILDLRELLSGGSVALLKTAESWQLSLEQLPKLLENGDQSRKSSKNGIDYRGYLRLLLMQKSAEKLNQSTMDLVEYNMRTTWESPGFCLDQCVDELEAGFTVNFGKRTYEITRSYGYDMQ